MPVALIALDFDPILRVGDIAIRWQAVALTGIVFLSLALAGFGAVRARLRADDLLLIVVGVVTGAVIGGRLGYVLTHADFYLQDPASIVDPAQGSASLGLAVLGGALTGTIVARLLRARVRPWLEVAALPVLVAIGLGKLTMVLAGSGQGLPAQLEWATAYVGPGPWGSLAPTEPSHPAQAYEGLATLAIAIGVAIVVGLRAGEGRPTGRILFVGLASWAVARFLVGFTWRDATVVGPLRAEQLMALVVAAVCLALALVRPPPDDGAPNLHPRMTGRDPQWPDPSSRPRF